ncbi:polysaccharide deacetylase family protein [Micrococcus porci]|uniref:polysaccharide deacetylase family protein n=1 Tax=Micrococcus porci TaxID=2856555 RepID=UPI003CE9A63F
MPSHPRLRLTAGLAALALAATACGGAEQQPAAGSPAPASSSSSAASTSPSSTTSASSDAPASSSSSAASSASASESSSAASSASASESSAAASAHAAAPVEADLGGPTTGVAPADTPVAVSSTAPMVEKVDPVHVAPARPAAPSASQAPSATQAPSASSSTATRTPSASASASASSAPAATAPAHAAPVPRAGVDCRAVKCIALTFDDGPGRSTARLLDILSAERVPATFYLVGHSAEINPSLVKRITAEGHEVGNHSYDHPNLTTLSPAQIASQITRSDAAIRAAGGRPSTVRAPYGALNESVLSTFGGLPAAGNVTWTVDTRDWEHKNPAKTLAAVQQGATPGGIVLMHDIHATSVDAVPAVIAYLRSQGYTFVTVDTITGGVTPGTTVRRGMHP